MNFLIILISSIVVLFLVLGVFTTFLTDTDYESSLIQCSILFKSIDGKPAFFGEKLDSPTFELFSSISEICSGKDIVATNSAKNSAELINDCWTKTGAGIDIFGATTDDQNICVYCGLIKGTDESENFPELLSEELNDPIYNGLRDTVSTNNINRFTLFEEGAIPELTEDNSIMVMYFIHKPKVDEFGEIILNEISKRFGSLSTLTSVINYLSSTSSSDSISGIALSSWSTENPDFEVKENPSVQIEGTSVSCDHLVIPQKIFK